MKGRSGKLSAAKLIPEPHGPLKIDTTGGAPNKACGGKVEGRACGGRADKRARGGKIRAKKSKK